MFRGPRLDVPGVVQHAPACAGKDTEARLVDGVDEVHMQHIAANVIAAFREDGTTRRPTGYALL